MSDNKKVGKSILYNSIGSGIYLFCQWLITFIVVWISGYETAGIFSIAMSVSTTFCVIATLNMRNYQSSDINGRYSEKTYLFTRLITCIAAVFITFIYSLIKGFSFTQKLCINIYMLYKISEAIVDVLHGSIQKKWRFDVIGLSYIIRGVLSIILFSLTLFITKNIVISLVIMTLGVYLFIYFFDINKYKKIIKEYGNTKKIYIIQLLVHCIPLSLYGIIFSYVAMYPKVFAESILGTELIGYYSSVATPALIIQVAASFLFTPLISVFSDYYIKNNKKAFNKSMFKMIILIIVLTLLVLVFSHYFVKDLLTLIFGKSITKYTYLFSGVVVISSLTALIWFVGMLLTIIRKNKDLLYGSLISLITVWILTPKLINKYGIEGINYVLLITLSIQFILFVIFILKSKNKENEKEREIYYIRCTSIINDSRASKEITSLMNNGYNVKLIGWDRTHIIKDYNNIQINKNRFNGIFFKYKCNYGGSIKNILGLLLFQIWLFFKLIKHNKNILCIHACDFDCGFAAYLVCNLYDIKLVYDMYDYYSDSREMSEKMKKRINKLENNVINYADLSIICGDWRKKQIEGSNPKKLIVIHNSPEIKNIDYKKIMKSKSKKIKIVYVGILQEHRLLLEVLEAMKKYDGFELHIGGFGKYEKEFIEASKKYKNIFFYGSLKYSEVLSLEKDCDILFATYDPLIKNHKYSAPNKIYEAMALGKPIVVCKETGIDELITRNKTGIAINYSSEDFIKALDKLNNEMDIKEISKRTKKLYDTKYNWNSMEEILIKAYKEVLGGKNVNNNNTNI